MKRFIVIALYFVIFVVNILAEDVFVVMRQETGCFDDEWLCTGAASLETNAIKKAWDNGKRITSVSYGAYGWFISCAKNTGYTKQTCHLASDWPKQWIKEKNKEGYFITHIAQGEGKWLVVMSQGTGFTEQAYCLLQGGLFTNNKIHQFIKEGYYITHTCPYNDRWLCVFSKNAPYKNQDFAFFSSYEDMKQKIKRNWNQDYNITSVSTNAVTNMFMLVMSSFSDSSSPAETYIYQDEYTSASYHQTMMWIKEKKGDGYSITNVGGNSYSSKYGSSLLPASPIITINDITLVDKAILDGVKDINISFSKSMDRTIGDDRFTENQSLAVILNQHNQISIFYNGKPLRYKFDKVSANHALNSICFYISSEHDIEESITILARRTDEVFLILTSKKENRNLSLKSESVEMHDAFIKYFNDVYNSIKK